jgi:peptidoglycan/LPS O-acetylase OafA/YrhL
MTDDKLDYVNALRGIAILMVLTVHAGQYVEVVEPVTRWGARGVQLFFVASAFTMVMSWRRRNDGAIPFYVRRIFRIAPLFWLGILFYVSIAPATAFEVWHIVATATFTHGLFPQTISFVVPGGWSIANEMMFYAIFPLLMLLIGGVRLSLIALLLAAIGSTYWLRHSLPVLQQFSPATDLTTLATFSFLALPAQMTAFAAGIAAFAIGSRWPLSSFHWRATVANIGLALALAWAAYLALYSVHDLVGYGLVFGVVVLCMHYGAGRWIPNRVLNHFGEISFSMYLAHFYLLTVINGLIPHDLTGWLKFALLWSGTAGACFVFCSFVYRFIEVPSMDFGRRLARAIASRKLSPA